MNNRENTIIVTGANTGLGYYCAKNIAAENRSCHVILACRDEKKGQEAVMQMKAETGNPHVTYLHLDLSLFASAQEFATQFNNNKYPPLKAIVCNAGISLEDELSYTTDGIETTFQVNCLSHFLLIHLLLKKLDPPARIIMVSSELHRNDGPMKAFLPNYTNANDLAYPDKEKSDQKGLGSIRYSTSKLCMVMYAHKFMEWFTENGINGVSINAYNPGLMPDTSLGGLNKKLIRKLFLKYILPLFVGNAMSTPQKSGKLLADLVISRKFEGVTGKYFDREKEIEPSKESFDKIKITDLWNVSMNLTNIQK